MGGEDLSNGGFPIAKVADFGLAKRFEDYVRYEKTSRVLVPWKWMAIEFLKSNFFTLKSDVWSYGVLVWEIFSFGGKPYGQQDHDEVLKKLENGYRLPFPENIEHASSWSPESFYKEITEKCFIPIPEERSTFADVVKIIETQFSSKEIRHYNQINDIYRRTKADNYIKQGKRKTKS